jgi:hypothetical protein
MTVPSRIAAMQPEELRFRLTCEWRKAAGRLRWTVARPSWDRQALKHVLSSGPGESSAWPTVRSALRGGDHHAIHRALAAHFTTRPSALPLNARALHEVTAAIQRHFPDAARQAASDAEAIVAGSYKLLGYRNVPIGTSPDWHADPIHDRRSPDAYWAAVPFLDPAYGDHKIIWELNRHQHWLILGRAHALTGDRRFYSAFTSQVSSWLPANPPLTGTNWASMLELGFRALSWMWALEMFAGASERDDTPWLVDLLIALDRQLTHVEENLSYYFSPNTHLTGEALALYVAGLALPELAASGRRAARGRDVLIEQATRQIAADGGHAELSPHYHRYSTDFYLLALAVARRAGDSAASVFEDAARRQAKYLRTICDDGGIRPAIGDDDGGQLFPVCGRAAQDCRDTLAHAAIILDEPSLATGPSPEETFWLCGPDAARSPASPIHWRSAALPVSGYYVSRTARGDHLVFDAGPHGFLNGGHAHADALSFTLSVAGTPLLIDGGTGTYTMDAGLRDRLRSTMMHNTVVLDGRSQSEPRGPFQWRSRTNAEAPIWRSTIDCDYVEGTHDGYRPVRHTRAILAMHGIGWWILDHLVGSDATHAVETYWHLDPRWTATLSRPQICELSHEDTRLALASSSPLTVLAPGQHPLAMSSPDYGLVTPAPALRSAVSTRLPVTFATFVPATAALARDLSIESLGVDVVPGDHWHTAAFRLRWQKGAITILSAIERTGKPGSENGAPPHRWGPADLQSDARVAVLIDYASAASEAVLVNGSVLKAQGTHEIVSIARRVPLLRLTPTHVAPRVHEVGEESRGTHVLRS